MLREMPGSVLQDWLMGVDVSMQDVHLTIVKVCQALLWMQGCPRAVHRLHFVCVF